MNFQTKIFNQIKYRQQQINQNKKINAIEFEKDFFERVLNWSRCCNIIYKNAVALYLPASR